MVKDISKCNWPLFAPEFYVSNGVTELRLDVEMPEQQVSSVRVSETYIKPICLPPILVAYLSASKEVNIPW